MHKKKNRAWNTALGALGITLVGAAILDQLRQPPEQRTWQGHVLSSIPSQNSLSLSNHQATRRSAFKHSVPLT